jgi:hypothetical protein
LKTAVALMFISSVGIPISKFNPENYVKNCLEKGHHHADYTSCPTLQEGHTKYPAVETSGNV